MVISAVSTACTVKGARSSTSWLKLAVLLALVRAKGEMENTVAVRRPLLSLTHWKETLRKSKHLAEADSRISDTWLLLCGGYWKQIIKHSMLRMMPRGENDHALCLVSSEITKHSATTQRNLK